MLITVRRLRASPGSVLSRVLIDGIEECYGLEPPAQPGRDEPNWAIPEGEYRTILNQIPALNAEYRTRFGSWHQGLVQLKPLARRQVFIRIGNSGLDTLGCLLVGLEYFESPPNGFGQAGSFWLAKSTMAYQAIYPRLVEGVNSPDGARVRVIGLL